MSKLNHLFTIGQKVRRNFDGEFLNGTVTETFTDHIIVNVPTVSDHCYFDTDMMDMVYPEYNF